MANTEWWQRGPVEGVPALLQPVAHILLQVGESVAELTESLTDDQWNARPAGIASAAFHVRHMTGVIDRLFTYARGESLNEAQFASLRAEGQLLSIGGATEILDALQARVRDAVEELRSIDVATLGDFRGVGRAQLPSTVIGCLVHGAEHAMRHVGQLSVTIRVGGLAARASSGEWTFERATEAILHGDCTALTPLFQERNGSRSQVLAWLEEGRFDGRRELLAETLTTAAWLGSLPVMQALLDRGVPPNGGSATGMDALHWAANRGELESVRLLLARGARTDTVNMHGGNVLDCAQWSQLNEPHPAHPAILQALRDSGGKR
ncbi:MAG: hypothetical protein JWO05_932 [Gemmatimonadetes bacterium]|nr:hypothetical protein [Gemmatimonadota bacterium]